MTNDELDSFYETVWNKANRTHMIMIKLLLYTGIRNSELINIKLSDVNLKGLRIRIQEGKGKKGSLCSNTKIFSWRANSVYECTARKEV